MQNGSARATRIYDKIANDANRAMHEAGEWEFDRTTARLVFAAVKTAGTIAIAVDGTALTGSGTSFASADAGKHMRYSGEDLQYLVSAYGSGTSLTMEAYRGSAALTAATYQLTQERVALPTRFRTYWPARVALRQTICAQATLREIEELRMYQRELSIPRLTAVEHYTASAAGGAPAPYLWVYPAPSDKAVLDLSIFQWPVEMSTATDGISAPQAAEKVHREYLRAYLLLEQGKPQEADNQMRVATAMARSTLGAHRSREDAGVREYWTPEGDADSRGRRGRSWPAPGEPVHM